MSLVNCMRIILLADVAKVGRKYEVKNVADGFGRNFLIAHHLAEVASPSALARLEKLKETHGKKVAQDEQAVSNNLAKLMGSTVTIKVRANEIGHLFASIHNEAIVQALMTQTGATITAENIILDKPIKEIGTFRVPISALGKRADFTLIVEKEF